MSLECSTNFLEFVDLKNPFPFSREHLLNVCRALCRQVSTIPMIEFSYKIILEKEQIMEYHCRKNFVSREQGMGYTTVPQPLVLVITCKTSRLSYPTKLKRKYQNSEFVPGLIWGISSPTSQEAPSCSLSSGNQIQSRTG